MRVIAVIGLLLAIVGCAKRATVGDADQYEIVWVDPQIVLSDSLITVIRSERVDSLYLDPAERGTVSSAPAVRFMVPPTGCLVSASLVSIDGTSMRPLLERRLLGPGFYRLTLNVGSFTSQGPPLSPYELRVSYCDSTATVPVNELIR